MEKIPGYPGKGAGYKNISSMHDNVTKTSKSET
jgi:hypothetical protein